MPRLSVVIPTVQNTANGWSRANVTMRTLRAQTFRDFACIPVWDRDRRGASWARNEGFRRTRTELVLFSDDDIDWRPGALDAMVGALDAHPEASYSYGAYLSNWIAPGRLYTISAIEFSAERLRESNFVSTMSVIRSAHFPGFDESLKRHQDWDLWLTMLDLGRTGVYCGEVVFETRLSPAGISFGSIPMARSRAIIRRKHGI